MKQKLEQKKISCPKKSDQSLLKIYNSANIFFRESKLGSSLLCHILPALYYPPESKGQEKRYEPSTIKDERTKVDDTFVTIVQTAKKLCVSVCNYIFDRVSNRFEILSLAKMIREKSALRWKWVLSIQYEKGTIFFWNLYEKFHEEKFHEV